MITIKDIEKIASNAENYTLIKAVYKLYPRRYEDAEHNRQYKMAVKQLRQNINALM